MARVAPEISVAEIDDANDLAQADFNDTTGKDVADPVELRENEDQKIAGQGLRIKVLSGTMSPGDRKL